MRQYHLAEFPQFLRTNFANKTIVKYQETDLGPWLELSGEAFADRCLDAAKGLAREGIQPQDRVGIYSSNSVYGLEAEIGMYMMRAISVPLYATSSPEQVDFIVRDSGLRLIFVGQQFQYNNAYEVQRTGGFIERIVIFDRNVVLHPEDKTSVYYDEFIRRGDAKAHENAANVSVSQALDSDIAVIIYTSGTSGRSKGVLLRHEHLKKQLEEHIKMFPFLSSRDVSMSFLPHSHIFEKIWAYYCLRIGATVAILSDPKKILQALPQVRPTMMCNVPRFWEKVYAGVQEKIASSSPMAQRLLRHASRIGETYRLHYYNEGHRAPLHLKLLYKLYEHTLFAKLKRVLGLQRGRFFPTAGASLSVEVNRFLQSVGIPICFGYGLSESTATVSCFPQKGFDIQSVGRVVDHVSVRIDPETSEIQLKGPTIITEYYNNPEANAEAFTADGYFRTGDAGRLEGKTLFFTERIKDLFKTANGKYIAPQMLEGLLAMDPIFEQTAIIGDGYKFVSALIYPNWEILTAQAQARGLDTEVDRHTLAENHEVQRIITAHLEQALGSVAQFEKVKKFVLLSEPFSIENGELTSTLKIRRKVVAERYAEAIRRMYEEA
ncbi:long-chain fatty acid--CoA ligase [Porphyromonas sp. COT-239 OH1446]|uniref:AMP-dependent synthetase/ligase n=1 Tax=Porphyromonas sp. COT-239 OH1446 TaxID=1515613 RepID=UPI00052CAE02|nr:long-chain fatty acid--CoA ligase [Porphyromonas sp. COT-239 OH1446]KGN72147.1 long-chain fatty acid--CoA ligase [Porphyromonas sp. COT-239 OH1446]